MEPRAERPGPKKADNQSFPHFCILLRIFVSAWSAYGAKRASCSRCCPHGAVLIHRHFSSGTVVSLSLSLIGVTGSDSCRLYQSRWSRVPATDDDVPM